MTPEQLRASILQYAMEGKLVKQDPNDEPASDTVKTKSMEESRTEPYKIPVNWKWIRLGSGVRFINGRAYKKSELLTDSNLTPVLRVGNLFTNSSWYYSDLKLDKDKYIDNGDLIYAWSASFGPRIWNGGHVIYHYHIWKTVIKEGIDKKFLYYFLSDPHNVLGETKLHGSTMKHVTKTNMEKLPFPLPPLEEQKRIVAKIEKLMPLVDEYAESYNRLQKIDNEFEDKLKQSVLQYAMEGKLVKQNPSDEPASELIKKIENEKAELIKEGKIKKSKKLPAITDDEKPFDIPNSWEWIRLGDYAEKITDEVASGSFAAIRDNVRKYKTENYAIMVKTADFANHFSKNLTYTDEHGYNFLNNSNLFGGELILSNIGSIGKCFIVPKLNRPMTLAPNSIMTKLIDPKLNKFLYYFIKSPIGNFELLQIASGTTMKKFNKTNLKGILIPIPPLNEQKRIVFEIEKIVNSIDKLSK
ncbi:restriction endonuclease subunit S [Lactobacillus amylovorus]|uniref:Restriction endonuclease subunit S n=1 Tax=Lactobacillus amylovorus TaxID=1604 RepID=A0AAW6BAU0_LACAM|nr:restriction endonuclease subunit S [Lactobacillus amylovorus]MDA6089818.1 restriction endonuclease subunit S [Lactobacillus amylovorus]MDB6222988.1 restriction endonuclease subunit S [Lactobacillus amylovorus]MDB6247075.1 restriction endonuclease subunit S [Lactobacillus amylovorus]